MRRSLLRGTAALLAGLAAVMGGGVVGARAQQPPDVEAVRRANAAIYPALSPSNLGALQSMLASEPPPSVILPLSRVPAVGWDAIRRDYEAVFARYPEFGISMAAEPEVRIASGTALVTGVEAVRARQANGEAASFSLLATNVFVRGGDGRWLLVHRHVSPAPR